MWRQVLAMLLATAAGVAAAADGYEQWRQQADQRRQDPALLRLYTFEEKTGYTVANQAGEGIGGLTLLSNSPYGMSRERRWLIWNEGELFQVFPEWTEGRWPGKGALRSGLAGTCVVRSRWSGTEDGIFTIAAWVRVDGGDGDSQLFNVGPGWGSGWRITYTHAKWRPNGSINFRLGIPKDVISVNTESFTPEVWHFLVCLWDGQALRVFVDGEPVAATPCTGPYVPIERNERWSQDFDEMDVGGLHFGGKPGKLRYDTDEVAVYGRALSADEVRALYEAGRPAADADAQRARYAELRTRERELARIEMTVPGDTYGIFPRGRQIPATVTLPAALGWTGAYTAHFRLVDVRNTPILEESRSLAASPAADAVARLEFAPEICTVYFLDMWVTDPAGKEVKRLRQEYGLAVVVPLPAPKDIPLTSALATHNATHTAENGVIGVNVDRWIKSNGPYRNPPEFDESVFAKEFAFERNRDFKVMFCFHLWAPPDAERVPGKKWLMKDMTPWTDYVRQVYRHYQDDVAFWEIENEPNAGGLVAADEYAVFLKTAYEALKDEDPNCTVVGISGCPGFLNYNKAVFAAGGAAYFDVMSLHNYCTYPISSYVHDRRVQRAVEQLVEARGQRVPVWNGESGFHTVARTDGRPMGRDELVRTYGARVHQRDGQPPYLAADMPTLTEHDAACWQVQAILLDLAAGCSKYFMLNGVSHYYPPFNASDWQPAETAPAVAALAAVLIPYDHVAPLPLTSSTDAGVIVTQTGGRRIAVLFSDETPTLSFRAGRPGTFTGMDMNGNPLSWETTADGVLTLRLAPAPTYVFDVPERFSQLKFMAVDDVPDKLPDNGIIDGKLIVTNPLATPLKARLAVVPPKDATIDIAAAVSVAPGKHQTLPFHLDGTELGRKLQQVDFQLIVGDAALGKLSWFFASDGAIRKVAEQTAFPPLGTGDWWRDLKPETCTDVDRVVHGPPIVGVPWAPQWRGADDLSFTLRLAWVNEQTLRLRIDVTDNTLLPATPELRGRCFKYDCVELFFDGRSLAQDTYGKGVEQMLVIPSTARAAAPCDFWFAGKEPTVAAGFVGAATDTGYWIEGDITPLPGAVFKVRAGSQLAFDVLVDDCDVDTAPRKAAMALHGVFNNATDPSRWGRYQLDPAPKQ